MIASMQTTPVSAEEFAEAMLPFGPFERQPHLAVAVSGGGDSMALAVLADAWARAQEGRISAIIVDHGLRDNSLAEATLTADRLSGLGINNHIIAWPGSKPETAIQSAARRARYDLLDGWCRDHGVLHLLVAHHADDQAETFVMRLQHGSGSDGLAAMAPVRALRSCRLVRPLLDFPKQRLLATLRARGVDWVEDPSNANPKYARSAVRASLLQSDADVFGIIQATRRFARTRRALESQTSDWLARHAVLDPAGYLALNLSALQETEEEIRLRVLSRAALAIGGKTYPVRIASLERLARGLDAGQGATLGSARFTLSEGLVGVYREARNLPAPQTLGSGKHYWDGRFLITVSPQFERQAQALSVLPWGPEIDHEWPRDARPDWLRAVPGAARIGLPVIRCAGVLQVPKPGHDENNGILVRFQPTMPMSGGGFTVA